MDNVKCLLASTIDESRSPYQLMIRCEALLQDGDAFGQFKEFANQMAQNDTIWSSWFDFVLLLLHVVFGNP